MVLRSAGYAVQEAYSRQQALVMACSDLVDVILICHTVPENEKQALVSAVRKQRSLIPVLCISDADFPPHIEHGCSVVSNTPDELLAIIHSAVAVLEQPGI